MPARHRDKLLELCNGHLVMAPDPDECLLVYPLPEWERIEDQLANIPNINKQVRLYQRFLQGYATECDLDAQGRVLIPPPLRAEAKLDKRVVLMGQGKKLELWDEDTLATRRAEWRRGEQESAELTPALESILL